MTKFIKYLRNFCIIILIYFLPEMTTGQEIVINEIMSSNASTIADEDGDYPDWIELYNYGEDAVDLAGWGLSDDPENLFRWVFPQVSLGPGEFLLVWASGKDRRPDSSDMTNGLMREVYNGIPGANVSDLVNHPSFPDQPSSTGIVSHLFEAPTNIGDNYGQRMHGWIKAPVSGEYTFWIATDDEGHLYLSPNEEPADAQLVAQVPGWTLPREWNKYPEQQSESIYLQQGQLYYIKALMKEAYGGDCLAVGWQLPDGTLERPIAGEHLFWKDAQLHTNFAIASGGEDVLITNAEGEIVDHLPPQVIPADISWGRFPDAEGEMMFFSSPTPGQSNHAEGYTELLSPPGFSHSAGFYTDPFDLILSHEDPEVTIIYTLDGSQPDPANLEGITFGYKNTYPEATHSSPGPMLYSSYISYIYEEPLGIYDRTSEPEILAHKSSTFHANPLYFPQEHVFKGTVVRARSFKEGALPGDVVSSTFFVSPEARNRYHLPVISLGMQSDHLFGYENGIYVAGEIFDNWRLSHPSTVVTGGSNANYHQRGEEWEYPAHLEFFEPDSNTPDFSQGIGVRIHGGWTRALPMKSLRLYARRLYGESRFHYRIFPDQDYESYNRLILRNSGNDFPNTMFRDAAIQAMVSHLDLDVLAYRPSVLFINGEYWGIHNIRERYDKHYLERVYGVDPENIDLLNYVHGLAIAVREGDRDHYNSMVNYINTHGLTSAHHYNHIQTLMDVENFTDYNISNIFVYNHDWPGNNTELWRQRNPYDPEAPAGHDGRWRWLLFDTDYGLGWWNNNVQHNTLEFATAEGLSGWPNPDFSTFLLRKLLENTTYRNYFISRFADLLNTTFLPQRTIGIVTQMQAVIEPEMPEHLLRWSMLANMEYWQEEVEIMTDFLERRPGYQRQHIRQKFNLPGYTQLNVDVSDPSHGYVKVNTIDLVPSTKGVSEYPYPWSGVYFQGVPVNLQAIPKPGYTFARWEGVDNANENKIQQVFSDTMATVAALFTDADLLHYWHFNDLPPGNLAFVLPDQSLVDGAMITYPGTGEGYFDRVSDGTEHNALPGEEFGYGLRVRNPSDTRELLIAAPAVGYKNITISYATKRTNNGVRWQELEYKTGDDQPWQKLSPSIKITEEWDAFLFALPNEGVDNNPDLKIRILFRGDEAKGTSGNNRFDNIRIEGIAADFDVTSVMDNETKEEGFRVWYSQGMLHVVNPFSEPSTLHLYAVNGVALKRFSLNGSGHYTLPFAPGTGIYVARLLGDQGVMSIKFIVK